LSGLPAGKIIEAHGSFATAHCLECGKETSTEYVLAAGVRRGEIVRCAEADCDGLVKPDIVFFGEGLPDKFFKHLSVRDLCSSMVLSGDLPQDLNKADLIIVIGTSLQVQPFSLLSDKAGPAVPRLLINREAVGPFEALETGGGGGGDYMARFMGRGGARQGDMLWKGDADDGVRRLCAELGWEADLAEMITRGRAGLESKWKRTEGVSDEIQSGDGDGDGEEVVDSLSKDSERDDPVLADVPARTPTAAQPTANDGGKGGPDRHDTIQDTEVERSRKAIEKDLESVTIS
jgi:NAD-dependent histone deacetylase SIR2/NAD-dependent deacetylase sirtuin 2